MPGPCPSELLDVLSITCPVMSALVKNGHLKPDCEGFVSKRQVREALLRVGISGKVVRETTDGNFDHLQGDDDAKRLNLFAMNTITGSPVGGNSADGALEHFRSTGIRDTSSGPNAGLYEHFHARRRVTSEDFTQFDVSRAIAAFDVDHGFTNIYGEMVSSNDLNQDHDARRLGQCAPADSMMSVQLVDGQPDEATPCFSNLWGSIIFMFQEFGTPTGPNAVLSASEMRALFLRSDLPSGFEERNPSSCAGGAYGCGSCWDDFANATEASVKEARRHRYCRCMLAVDFVRSGGFTAGEDIELPGVIAQESSAYRNTCHDSPSGGVQRRHLTEGEDGSPSQPACTPFCFAGGGPASGHYGNLHSRIVT